MKKVYQGIIFPIFVYLFVNLIISSIFEFLYKDANKIFIVGISAIIGNIILFLNAKYNKKITVDICFRNEKKIILKKFIFIISISFGFSLSMNILFSIIKFDKVFDKYNIVLNDIMSLNPILLVVFVGFIIPMFEEIIFRGYIYKSIKAYKSLIFAKFISAFMFGLFHMNLIQGIFAFISSFLITFIYDDMDNIIVPISMHMIMNITSFLIPESFILSDTNKNDKIFILIVALVIQAIGIYRYNLENKTD